MCLHAGAAVCSSACTEEKLCSSGCRGIIREQPRNGSATRDSALGHGAEKAREQTQWEVQTLHLLCSENIEGGGAGSGPAPVKIPGTGGAFASAGEVTSLEKRSPQVTTCIS